MLIIDEGSKGIWCRGFVICVLVIQIVMFLYLTGNHKQDFTFEFIDFFAEYKLITNYLIVVNIATFIAFVIDKYNAVTNRTRIRIVTLLILSFIGGSIGGMLAMYLFRHKIRKDFCRWPTDDFGHANCADIICNEHIAIFIAIYSIMSRIVTTSKLSY